MERKTFKAGDKVRSLWGENLTVRGQDGVMVWVEEKLDWYHPEKLHLIEKGETR